MVFYYYYNAQGDVMGLRNDSGNSVVQYTYDSWGKLLSTTGTMAGFINPYNPFRYRGYFYDEETGLYYLNSRYYDPETGRFINADGYVSTGQGLLGTNMFAYCENNPANRHDMGGMLWKELFSGILHGGNNLAIAFGIDTAAIGAFFLMMEKDDSGVYYATFDCWQQYAGYNVFYDFAFGLGTSMVSVNFSFSYDGCGYTIWAWKGDYINLGAGAELGIYCGDSGHRTVDTSLAMWMCLYVSYNNELIINRSPTESQWWITGFNPEYQNANAYNLSVTVAFCFNNSGMYNAFYNKYHNDSSLTFIAHENGVVFNF